MTPKHLFDTKKRWCSFTASCWKGSFHQNNDLLEGNPALSPLWVYLRMHPNSQMYQGQQMSKDGR